VFQTYVFQKKRRETEGPEVAETRRELGTIDPFWLCVLWPLLPPLRFLRGYDASRETAPLMSARLWAASARMIY
jgi:hypothetical protein